MPVQAPQWTEFLSCPICYNEFEANLRRPISLGCGHTMCKSCLSKLQRKQCPFDQTTINSDITQLPENFALLQLVGGSLSEKPPSFVPLVSKDDLKFYLAAKKFIEELALYLKTTSQNATTSNSQSSPLSRPMQRKLVTLINCQLVEEEGRTRAMRAARSLGERSVTELILQHQNPQQLSANLWAAVRARGCQFLGPAMQEEVLKLVLLALEDGSALSRKVLVMFVVQRLAPHFPQASKTSIGHVVQLLYRASCFKVSKREGDSSLMQLKEEFRTYEALRREHDAQIVQIATEAGLRIAPEQWSSLLYGDTAHKSHMQSIIDKLQTPQSFGQSVQELVIALQRTGDPGNLSVLRPHLELLAGIDPSPDTLCPLWEDLRNALEAAKIVVKGLVEFIHNFGSRKLQEDRQNLNAKYKTSMCRDLTQKGSCPRGANCTFAHSQEELEKYRAKNKRSIGSRNPTTSIRSCNSLTCSSAARKEGISASSNQLSPCNLTNSLVSSEAVFTLTDGTVCRHPFDGQFLKDNPSACRQISTATGATSHLLPSSHLASRCLTPNVTHLSCLPSPIQTSPSLNPETPAFQPLTVTSSTQLLTAQSYQSLSPAPIVCPESYSPAAAPPTAILGVIPAAIAAVPTHQLKLNSHIPKSCQVKHPQTSSVADSNYVPPVPHIPPATHIFSQSSKDLTLQSSALKVSPKDQSLTLEQRKKEAIALLGRRKSNATPSVLSVENGTLKSSDTDSVVCTYKCANDKAASFYSPWTSASIFSYASSLASCGSTGSTTVSSSSASRQDTASVDSLNNEDLIEIDNTVNALFCPSEKDEFIPFDPPLVSKYGPISRCSKSLIRGPAPIQVNAVSQMGELTSPTSVVRHPLPSASLAPSFYATAAPSFAVPVAIIPTVPEQFLPVVDSSSVVLPVTVDCTIQPAIDNTEKNSSQDNLVLKESAHQYNSEGGSQIADVLNPETSKLEQKEYSDQKNLQEEIWSLESSVKDRTIVKDNKHCVERSFRQKCDLKPGGTVPTSIGPWPSQTLEHMPFKHSEADYDIKVGEEINEFEQQWLEVLEGEDEIWGDGPDECSHPAQAVLAQRLSDCHLQKM